MKVLSLVLVLITLFLVTNGRQVVQIKRSRGGNVCVKAVAAHSKRMLGLMKVLEKKFGQIMKTIGSSSNTLSSHALWNTDFDFFYSRDLMLMQQTSRFCRQNI
jgi:hypothetical protein